jgi:hypothetical protein
MPKKKLSVNGAKTKKARATSIPTNIERLSGQRIMDDKLVNSKSDKYSYAAAVFIALGILVAAGVVGYLFFYKNNNQSVLEPNIIVPSDTQSQEGMPPEQAATTPTTTTPVAPAPPPVLTQSVKILATPTGFLNVRSGPGTNTAKVGQVNPGEVYQVLSDSSANGGWYQIRLSDALTGWIAKKYGKLQ